MAPELLESIESRIKSLDNSHKYDINLKPLNDEEIELEISKKINHWEERYKPGFRKIKKKININEEIKLKL